MHLFHILQCSIRNRNVHILFWVEHCGIWNRCILGFVKLFMYFYTEENLHSNKKTVIRIIFSLYTPSGHSGYGLVQWEKALQTNAPPIGWGHSQIDPCIPIIQLHIMMTSSNGNIFRITGLLCGEFTGHKDHWRRALMFSLICAWTNSWANNGKAGDWDATALILLS